MTPSGLYFYANPFEYWESTPKGSVVGRVGFGEGLAEIQQFPPIEKHQEKQYNQNQ